jgi:hypothetical protein
VAQSLLTLKFEKANTPSFQVMLPKANKMTAGIAFFKELGLKQVAHYTH